MRLWKILIALFALLIVAADAPAGPILRRIRERNAGASSCGSAAATATACGSTSMTTVSACTSDTLPVPMPPPSMPSGVTWTDTQGNLWQLVRPAPNAIRPAK
jgi:hypothetical protein